ncbi:acyl-CoA-binding domain-containing protein 3-like isoform X2 [Arachis stenosperma]|uniref:acyl-CoA-binding domain-containing protein 3-like isoform X2 n=1 Tax=Arachis stenosperma TaxID=217475 RepID=UPI0025ACB1BD|nr:acyl-CoA-binding domain-containing protein 3-like isoform X2 [Arachis stenosperma]
MELVTASDLFVTASLALLLSLLVAKLVSMAMASDPNPHNSHHQQQQQTLVTLQQERLTVQKPHSERKVEFLSPIQISTNVETARNREEESKVEIESRVVDFEVEALSTIAELSEEHVAAEAAEEEEGEVIETNGDSEEFDPREAVEDSMEQRKTEPVEDFGERKETEPVKDSEEQRETEDCEEQREEECLQVCEEQRETGCCEEQKDCSEDCEEQRKTEGITVEPFDDDGWEGIERSELEKEFISASEFVVGGGGNGLGSDVLMELYGLHKVATEGPCHEPQPMPLKLNARAKWELEHESGAQDHSTPAETEKNNVKK